MVSAIHELINPFTLNAVHAPTWYLPATFLYYYPTAVLEWDFGHVFVPPPFAKLESLIFHSPHPLRILSNGKTLLLIGIRSNEAPSHGIAGSLMLLLGCRDSSPLVASTYQFVHTPEHEVQKSYLYRCLLRPFNLSIDHF
jgi:hypothetical protein